MTAKLSEEQRRAISSDPCGRLRIIDDEGGQSYVLISAEDYERARALFEEVPFHPSEMAVLMDEVAAKEGWDDPEMSIYDSLDPETVYRPAVTSRAALEQRRRGFAGPDLHQ